MDLARTSVAAFAYRLIGMSFWLVVGIVTARALTLSDRGTYTSAVIVIGSVGAIGSSFAAASGYFVSNKRHAAAEVMCNEVVLSLGMGLAMLIGSCIVAVFLQGESRAIVLLVGAALLVEVARNAIGGVFLSVRAIAKYSFVAYGNALCGGLSVLTWILIFGHRTVVPVLSAWVVGQYVAFAAAAVLAWQWWAWLPGHGIDRALMRQIVRFGSITGLVAVAAFLSGRAGQLIVAAINGTAGAGVYASAVSLSDGLMFFAAAVATASYEQIGALSRDESAVLTARAVRHAALISWAGALVLFLIAPVLMRVLYGERYDSAVTPLRILVIGAAAGIPWSLLANYFIVQRGRPAVVLWLTVVASVINAGGGAALIAAYGYNGAALAATVSSVVVTGTMVVLFLRSSGLPFRELWQPRRGDVSEYLDLARSLVRGLRPARVAPADGEA
ncbi:MAG: oligosaccharide flippase family protein [Tepidiformaceae bacterium]